MGIKKIFNLNPIVWLIQCQLKRIEVQHPSIKPPQVPYKDEYWVKSPEHTLKDGYANCVNKAILNYSCLADAYKNDFIGINYFQPNGVYHSEFAMYKDEKMLEIIDIDHEIEVVDFVGLFITKEGIYHVF